MLASKIKAVSVHYRPLPLDSRVDSLVLSYPNLSPTEVHDLHFLTILKPYKSSLLLFVSFVSLSGIACCLHFFKAVDELG